MQAYSENKGELTARRLVIAFVPTTGLETGGLPSGGCGDSSAEREFPSDKVYGRDDLDCGVDRFVRFGVQDDVGVGGRSVCSLRCSSRWRCRASCSRYGRFLVPKLAMATSTRNGPPSPGLA